ncbi:MAG TPA: PAS domain S-box protein [Opitutus sp.]|nr:PAS domain S-box protein [Opitutus sp.]
MAATFGAGAGFAYVLIRRERRALAFEVRSLWERLDAIFYRSPLAVSLCELDLHNAGIRVLDCNEEAAVLHGGSRDEVIAAGVRMKSESKETIEQVQAWFRAPRPAELWRGETNLRKLNGAEVPIAYVWARVEIGDRELVLVVERDVSEQRQAESALKDSEQRFRQLVETADCMLWKARLREVDGKLEWKFDVPLSGLRQRLFAAVDRTTSDESSLWSGFNLPELPAMDERCKAALRECQESYRQEFRLLLPNETMWLQETVAIEHLGPKEWDLVGVIVDITRLKETEAAMRASEERHRLVLQASNDGIWDYDVAAKSMAASERCRSMLGLRSEEVPQSVEAWRLRIHPEDLDVEEAAWKKYRGTGEPCVYQARFRHADGSWRWFMVRAISVTDETGMLVRIIGSHTDITELQRNDRELQQSRRLRAIGELVGGIAHEFNNLLTPMLLQTTMMTDAPEASLALREQLKPVIGAVKEARELTQRILTFGRRSSVNAEALDLTAAVDDNLALLRHAIDRRVVLDVKTPESPLWVYQNRTDVAQIVVNLVLNARDTLMEKIAGCTEIGWIPTISIRLTTEHRSTAANGSLAEDANLSGIWHRVTIRDNGMGMTEQVRERMFEPFYTTKEVGQGTGLGLATVWHLIKTMGGRVETETTVGSGSAFHISLPATAAPLAMLETVRGRRRGMVGDKFARILLVEDQPEVAESLSRILEMWGHRVTILRDGVSALRELTTSAGNFDVCITDLNMPGATGFEVVRMIREKKLPLKVIVMGGYLTAPIRQDLEAATVDAIVPKPFSMEDLEAAIRVSGW